MDFKVMVSGVVMYETPDELCACAVAHSYRETGWKNVEVLEPSSHEN